MRDHFHKNDVSVFADENFVQKSYIEKAKQCAANFIKISNAAEQQYPKEMSELIFNANSIAPIGGIYLSCIAVPLPIKLLGTDEQSAKWTKLIVEGRILCAYAQTEVGHGSDVQSLMTTAIYNKEKKTFVINSPSTKSVKFWPGCLGWQATHVLCQAQTFVSGKYYGLQTFIVPIRDTKTYKIFEGVQAGDVGLKLGLPASDQGYLQFTKYEVPRENLLMRYITVKEDGTVTRGKDKNAVKIAYGGMLGSRVHLSLQFLLDGFKAVVISYRSLIKGGELSLLARREMANEIAYLYSNILTNHSLNELHRYFTRTITTNVPEALGVLSELHLLSSGFKAYNSQKLIEQVRVATLKQSVGNLVTSGTIYLYGDTVAAVTLEGDNAVMLQQVARALIKFMQSIESGEFNKISSSFQYLVKFKELLEKQDEIKLGFEDPKELLNPERIEDLIGLIGLYSINEAYAEMKQKMGSGASPNQTWNEQLQTIMIHMATTIVRGMTYFIPRKFLSQELIHKTLGEDDIKLLEKLVILNGLNILKTESKRMCLFKIGASADKLNEIITEAQNLMIEQIGEKLNYLVESHPFYEEELYYVRDFKKSESLVVNQGSINSVLNSNLNKYVNTLSKL